MRKHLWWLSALMFALPLPGLARPVPVPESMLLGMSDTIVVGTVVRDERVDPEIGGFDGRATLRVNRAIRGDARGEIRMWHQKPIIPEPGIQIADDPGFDLAEGTQALFFLSRNRADYRLIGGRQGMRDAGEVDHFIQAITAFPVSITIKAPVGPFYFDRLTPVTFTVANAGADPVAITHFRLDGQYYAPQMGPDFVFNIQPFPQDTPPLPLTVPARGTQTITLGYRPQRPQSWLLFPPDSYLLTPVLLHTVAYVAPAGSPLTVNLQQQVASPWVDALIGYPPPAH